jgi:A/G-specific adenine glycosylase
LTESRTFAGRLLCWFDQHGRNNLPWQHPRTPYRVWVSEIMLQQTQVQTVIPYFERFMSRFPDMSSLAGAHVDEVLALWSGLGYYARGRNLHRTAEICMSQHAGELPETAKQLATLPGIGKSTANAIFSQARNKPAPVLDGNVRRVLARHEGIEGWTGDKAVLNKLWQTASERLPDKRGADYTQAIMDLGALVCVRGKPSCGSCPVSDDCTAFRDGRTAELPSKRPRPPVREVTLKMLVVLDEEGRVLLERRPSKGIWGGLWSLPEGDNATTICAALGLQPETGEQGPAINHRLTHRLLRIHPCVYRAVSVPDGLEYGRKHGWFKPPQLETLGLPKPVAGILDSLDQETET